MKENQKIIYYRESLLSSILADATTFVFLGMLLAFNHFLLKDSTPAAWIIFLVFLLFTVGKTTTKKHVAYSKEEVIKMLEE